jgi:hypothetical protein
MKNAILLSSAVVLLGASEARPATNDSPFARVGLSRRLSNDDYFGGVLSLGVDKGTRIYSVRLSANEEFNLFDSAHAESIGDLGLLIGARFGEHVSNRSGPVSAAVGLSVVKAHLRGGDQRMSDHYTIGVPVELSALLEAGGVGLGLQFLGDFNPKRSFGAVALVLQIGPFR